MGIFDSKTTSSSTTKPISELMSPMMQGVRGASDLYGRGGYQGDFVAGIDPAQLLGAQGFLDASQGWGNLGQQQMNMGQNLSQGLNQAAANYGNYTDPQAMAAQNVNIAGMLSNNPQLDAMIDASSRDVARNLNWNQLPGIAGSFGATGGTDSSKYAQQNVIAQQMAGDRLGDISSGMRGAAWQQGLAYGGQLQNLGLNATNAQANLGQYGMGLMNQGQQNMMQPSQAQMQIGGYRRGLDQSMIEGDRMAWQEPWNNLGQYGNFINPLASAFTTTNSQQTQKRNTAGVLAGMAAQLGGAYLTGGASLLTGGAAGAAGGGGGMFTPSSMGGAITPQSMGMPQFPGVGGY